jgi:SNF2 family DNA or RNA helicase
MLGATQPQSKPPRALVYDGRIYVLSGYEHSERCRAITGGRWDKEKRAWSYPASAAVAAAVADAFRPFGLAVNQEFKDVLARAESGARAKTAADDELANIPGTKTTPWLHQKQAYWFAANQPATMLAMGMGAGKSKVVVDLVCGKGYAATLIICPKSVVGVWPKQFATHGGREVHVVSLTKGTCAKKVEVARQAMALAKARGQLCVVVVNYESAWREPFGPSYDGTGKRVTDKGFAMTAGFDLVVLDESHKIKAPGGRASLFCGKLGAAIPNRLALTGTPMPHSPLDIYAQYRFLDPTIYGQSYSKFRMQYAVMGGYGGYEVQGYQRTEELNQKFYSIAYRVDKAYIDAALDLPEVVLATKTCELEPGAAKQYRELYKDFVTGCGDSKVTAANALTKLLRLQQITGGTVKNVDGELVQVSTAKQELFADVLDDIDVGEPVVVFARFLSDLDAVRAVAESQGRTYGELSGRDRGGLAADSTMAEGVDVLGVQIQAGGVGIDLTRARYAIYYSVGYSLGDYEQSMARCHRPGQTRKTFFVHLVCEGTVDEKVYQALAERRDVVEFMLEQAGGAK